LRDDLAAGLLTPEEAQAMEVHGRTDSAVLAPLFADAGGELHAVFTRRREDLSRHPGEISFPGGRRDPGETLLETALREAHEEVGLPPAVVDVLGALEPTPTFVTNYAIYPFVGLIEPGFEWVLEETEVAEVLELRLGDLRAAYGERRLVRKGIPFRTPTFEVNGNLIWGATARVLQDLLARVP
jgi:8-oxo-dGTP pyrophosphatase MutT (NUDIX family)